MIRGYFLRLHFALGERKKRRRRGGGGEEEAQRGNIVRVTISENRAREIFLRACVCVCVHADSRLHFIGKPRSIKSDVMRICYIVGRGKDTVQHCLLAGSKENIAAVISSQLDRSDFLYCKFALSRRAALRLRIRRCARNRAPVAFSNTHLCASRVCRASLVRLYNLVVKFGVKLLGRVCGNSCLQARGKLGLMTPSLSKVNTEYSRCVYSALSLPTRRVLILNLSDNAACSKIHARKAEDEITEGKIMG